MFGLLLGLSALSSQVLPAYRKTLQIRGTEVGGVDCSAVLTDPAGPRRTL